MQNIDLEMRKCVAGEQKNGAANAQLDLSPGKAGAHSARGGRIYTKEAARSEKAGQLVLNSTFRPRKRAHIRRGAGGFPQKRRRARRKRGRTLREGAKKAPHSTGECDARVGFAEIAGVLR